MKANIPEKFFTSATRKNTSTTSPRVLLIQPPIYDFAAYDLFTQPYGLLRIGKWFLESGFTVEYLDMLDPFEPNSVKQLGEVKRKSNGTGKFFRQKIALPKTVAPPPVPKWYSRYGILTEIAAARIAEYEPDLVCITTGMTYWYQGVLEAAELVRKHAPQALLITGGIYSSLMPEHVEKVIAPDCNITGEAWEPLRKFLEEKRFPSPGQNLPQFPALLPGSTHADAGVIRLNTGCPLHCDYCASDIISPRFAAGDPDMAFSYLEELMDKAGVRHIAFYDDALLVHKERVLFPFLEKVIASGRKVSFYTPNAVHVRYIDAETAQLLFKAGFKEVRMGYESSSEIFHEQHDHKFAAKDFSRALQALSKAGFQQMQLPVYILGGLPRQEASEVKASVLEAWSAGAGVSIAEYSPVPGTPQWFEACAVSPYPLAEEPVYHNNSYFVTAWEGFTPEDLQKLKMLARLTREKPYSAALR